MVRMEVLAGMFMLCCDKRAQSSVFFAGYV